MGNGWMTGVNLIIQKYDRKPTWELVHFLAHFYWRYNSKGDWMDGWMTRVNLIMMGTNKLRSLYSPTSQSWMDGWITGVKLIIQSSDGNPKGLSWILWPTSIEDFIPLTNGRLTWD
jgi:hypothetical protein